MVIYTATFFFRIQLFYSNCNNFQKTESVFSNTATFHKKSKLCFFKIKTIFTNAKLFSWYFSSIFSIPLCKLFGMKTFTSQKLDFLNTIYSDVSYLFLHMLQNIRWWNVSNIDFICWLDKMGHSAYFCKREFNLFVDSTGVLVYCANYLLIKVQRIFTNTQKFQ